MIPSEHSSNSSKSAQKNIASIKRLDEEYQLKKWYFKGKLQDDPQTFVQDRQILQSVYVCDEECSYQRIKVKFSEQMVRNHCNQLKQNKVFKFSNGEIFSTPNLLDNKYVYMPPQSKIGLLQKNTMNPEVANQKNELIFEAKSHSKIYPKSKSSQLQNIQAKKAQSIYINENQRPIKSQLILSKIKEYEFQDISGTVTNRYDVGGGKGLGYLVAKINSFDLIQVVMWPPANNIQLMVGEAYAFKNFKVHKKPGFPNSYYSNFKSSVYKIGN